MDRIKNQFQIGMLILFFRSTRSEGTRKLQRAQRNINA
jgi:hypothetical protein